MDLSPLKCTLYQSAVFSSPVIVQLTIKYNYLCKFAHSRFIGERTWSDYSSEQANNFTIVFMALYTGKCPWYRTQPSFRAINYNRKEPTTRVAKTWKLLRFPRSPAVNVASGYILFIPFTSVASHKKVLVGVVKVKVPVFSLSLEYSVDRLRE